MAMVDPHTGKIMKAETVLVDGVECLPKFDPTKLTYEPKEQHPLYRTTNNVFGQKKPCVYDVPTNYLCVRRILAPVDAAGCGACADRLIRTLHLLRLALAGLPRRRSRILLASGRARTSAP